MTKHNASGTGPTRMRTFLIDLKKLGFEKYRTLEKGLRTQFHGRTGTSLPDEYWFFLQFKQPLEMPLSFKFFHSHYREEWEGDVGEFLNIMPQNDNIHELEKTIIRTEHHPSPVFFPIATDGGGNYLYFDLGKTGLPVVDVDYGSGAISTVAGSFADFVGLLYRPEEEMS